jgi:ATP-binding cassette subfamily F protein 3
MTVISVSSLTLSFGDVDILKNVSFSLNEGDKLGIVGVNGAGKTSLFRVISGEYAPTEGGVFVSRDRSFGYLRQDEAVDPAFGNVTLLDYMLSMHEELRETERELSDTELAIAEADAEGDEARLLSLSAKLSRLHEMYAASGGLSYKNKAKSMLSHLGFGEEEHGRPISSLSGGQHTRLALARLLATEPDILLLDEPTNHLDIDALLWLEDFLVSYPKTVLVISHDRYFLDKVTRKTLMLDATCAKLYHGSYTAAKEQKELDDAAQDKRYREQQKIIRRIEENIAFQRRCGREHNFVTIRAKQKQLDRMEKVEAVKAPEREIGFSFQGNTLYSQDVLTVKGLSFSYGTAPILSDLSFAVKKDERVLLLGANGTGKSTVMQLLAGKLTPKGGSIRFAEEAKIGYYDQETRSFHEEKTVFEELHDEYPQKTNGEIRNALALFLFCGEDVDKPISALSGGERARLTLAKLMLKPVSVLLLDEPTTHLDIGSREALETALAAFEGTVVAVSHDRYFIDRVATRLIELSPNTENGSLSYQPYEDETPYACYLRMRETAKRTDTVFTVKNTAGKDAYEQKKREEAKRRAEQNKRAKAEKRIPEIEKELESLREALFGEAATDYVKASAIEEKISALEEELLTLYELTME